VASRPWVTGRAPLQTTGNQSALLGVAVSHTRAFLVIFVPPTCLSSTCFVTRAFEALLDAIAESPLATPSDRQSLLRHTSYDLRRSHRPTDTDLPSLLCGRTQNTHPALAPPDRLIRGIARVSRRKTSGCRS